MFCRRAKIMQTALERRKYLIEETAALYATKKVSDKAKEVLVRDCGNRLSEIEQFVSSLLGAKAGLDLTESDNKIWKGFEYSDSDKIRL